MWPGLVDEQRPDHVIVATGAEPARPWWVPADARHVVDVARRARRPRPSPVGRRRRDLTSSASTRRRRWPSCSPTAAATSRSSRNGMVVGQDLGITLDMENWWMRAGAKGIVQSTDLVPMGMRRAARLQPAAPPHRLDVTPRPRTGSCWPSPPTRSSGCTTTSRRPASASSGSATASRPRRAHAAVIEGERAGASSGSSRHP